MAALAALTGTACNNESSVIGVRCLALAEGGTCMSGYDRALYQTYLASVPLFRSCTTEQLDRLAELATAVAVHDREIVREGDPGTEFFVLTSGTARVTRGGHNVAELTQGDYFGELSLFDPAPRNATVSAVGEVSLVSLSR